MNEKNIIWGTGRLVKDFKKYINLKEILFFVDSDSSKQENFFMGKKVVLPEKIRDVEYDKLIVFTSKKYEEIYNYAVEYLEIDESKIVYWSHYYGYYNIQSTYETIENDCLKNGNKELLDIQFCLLRNSLYTERNLELWTYGRIEGNYHNRFIYKQIYSDFKDVLKRKHPKAIFLGRILSRKDIVYLKKKLSFLLENFQYIYFTLPYIDSDEYIELHKIKFLNLGKVREWNLQYEHLVCIQPFYSIPTIKIYIAMHKAFDIPQNDLYIPLWLGDTDKNEWGYQEDKQEPSISYINCLINECTGLYWMWKHAQCNYIGIVHYRRFFYNGIKEGYENILREEQIKEIFVQYDIITAPQIFFPISVYKQLKITVEATAFYSGYDIIKKLVLEKQPNYLNAFEHVMNGHSIFPCNMFITRKEIFDNYCEWLFSIIIDAAKQINVTTYSAYSKRIVGFFAERLFTVWLIEQPLKIKEMPVWTIGEIVDNETDITRLYQ